MVRVPCGLNMANGPSPHTFTLPRIINPHHVISRVALVTLRKWLARDVASEVDSWAAKWVHGWIVAVIKKISVCGRGKANSVI